MTIIFEGNLKERLTEKEISLLESLGADFLQRLKDADRRLRQEVVAIASEDIPELVVDGKTYRNVPVWKNTTSLDAAVDALEANRDIQCQI